MTTPPVFLIIEANLIIAEDILEAIKEYAATAVVHIWKEVEATADSFAGLSNLRAIFLSLRTRSVVSLGLDQIIAQHHPAIIVLSGRDRDKNLVDADWLFLDRPFTTRDIHALLKNLGIEADSENTSSGG